MKELDPVTVLREYCEATGTQKQAAKQLDLTESYLSDLLNRRRDVSDSVLSKLGLKRIVVKA